MKIKVIDLLNKIAKFDANIDKFIIIQNMKNIILILKKASNKYSLKVFMNYLS